MNKKKKSTKYIRVDHTSTNNFYDNFLFASSKSCQILKRPFDLRLLWKEVNSNRLKYITNLFLCMHVRSFVHIYLMFWYFWSVCETPSRTIAFTIVFTFNISVWESCVLVSSIDYYLHNTYTQIYIHEVCISFTDNENKCSIYYFK